MQGRITSGEGDNRELARRGERGSARPMTGIERLEAEAEALRNSPERWREEVVSRVQDYRTRRRRYNPDLSLHLDFDEQRRANRSMIVGATATDMAMPDPVAEVEADIAEPAIQALEAPPAPTILLDETPEPTPNRRPRKIIEFPRPAMAMHPLSHELAEPVMDGPRILEVPAGEQFELLPAVPAIMLDEAEAADPATQPPEDTMPLLAAPLARRFWCGAIDAAAIAAAVAAFNAAFMKVATAAPTLRSHAAWVTVAAVLAGFWMTYQYCFLVYGCATLGMRLTRLEARTFDGEPLATAGRRRRALAMVLSLAAAGLGFVWALLDEDALCWHDRISHSYLGVR